MRFPKNDLLKEVMCLLINKNNYLMTLQEKRFLNFLIQKRKSILITLSMYLVLVKFTQKILEIIKSR